MTVKRQFFDIECYANYFLAMFLDEEGRVGAVEMYDEHPLDEDKFIRLLTREGYELQTFNGLNYDMPISRLALTGATNADLKAASDHIIEGNLKGWQFERQYPQAQLSINHVDLMEVAPGRHGLKMYMARLHAKRMQELPIEPTALITPEQRVILKRYCYNDLVGTRLLSDDLSEQLSLRRAMTQDMRDELARCAHGHLMDWPDLRSKSDAQIAESVLKQRVFITTGAIPRKRPTDEKAFNYVPPEYIRFKEPSLVEALDTIRNATMVIKPDTGHVAMPKEIEKLRITIGSTTYKMGIGGLHSQESCVSHVATDDTLLKDIDVVSYYPSMILNMGMYPIAVGPTFLTEYRTILDERVTAKRAKQKVKADSLKITLNGTFGKTASKYSILYNPRMMIATTLTGQLSILMLIEALESRGIPVVSANTDGIVVKCPLRLEPVLKRIVQVWEQVTNLETEETHYKAIYSRDVNSYVAVKTDGSAKTKGAFAKQAINKSPQNQICADAVVAYLTKGVPVEDTIRACDDIRQFLTVRYVKGTAVKDGENLGKIVRWYRSTVVQGTMHYADNGNRVPRSARGRPVPDLPDSFPADVDIDWYIEEAREMLMDIAAIERPVWPKLPRRNTKKWKELEIQGLVEVDEYDKPCWAVHLDEIPPTVRQALQA